MPSDSRKFAPLLPGCPACDDIIRFRMANPGIEIDRCTEFILTVDTRKRHPCQSIVRPIESVKEAS